MRHSAHVPGDHRGMVYLVTRCRDAAYEVRIEIDGGNDDEGVLCSVYISGSPGVSIPSVVYTGAICRISIGLPRLLGFTPGAPCIACMS